MKPLPFHPDGLASAHKRFFARHRQKELPQRNRAADRIPHGGYLCHAPLLPVAKRQQGEGRAEHSDSLRHLLDAVPAKAPRGYRRLEGHRQHHLLAGQKGLRQAHAQCGSIRLALRHNALPGHADFPHLHPRPAVQRVGIAVQAQHDVRQGGGATVGQGQGQGSRQPRRLQGGRDHIARQPGKVYPRPGRMKGRTLRIISRGRAWGRDRVRSGGGRAARRGGKRWVSCCLGWRGSHRLGCLGWRGSHRLGSQVPARAVSALGARG